jgi:hypothetical protein
MAKKLTVFSSKVDASPDNLAKAGMPENPGIYRLSVHLFRGVKHPSRHQ